MSAAYAIKRHESVQVVYGHSVLEVWLERGVVYAQDESENVVRHVGPRRWCGQAGQVADNALIDKLEAKYMYLMGWR